MPTIELARLKQETARLSEYFSEPQIYLRGLERLLQNHAVPVHRQGRVRGLRPVLQSYEIPPPLLKHLQMEMAEQAKQAPQSALAVADCLWARRTIETRQLAARLLGAIDAEPQQLTSRLEGWAEENREPVLASELAQQATGTLCARFPEELVAFAHRMLASRDSRKQILALGALQNLLDSTHFANLPLLFDLLTESGKAPDRKLLPVLTNLLVALAARSPKETEYFLRQALEGKPNEGLAWVARRVVKVLPEESRARLRQVMKALP
jgi:hypothetical protein